MHHGWIIINKPIGMSSAHIVSKVKRLLGRENKVGHAGTLDPLATGVLPLAVGEAAKLVQFLIDSDKEYEFNVTWGEERSTDDAEGEVIKKSDLRPSTSEILEAIKSFTGSIEQVPPIFSAIKVDGQRSYDLARSDKEVELKSRNVIIHELSLVSEVPGVQASFKMRCSKGTYVRSIARDLGRKLGCYGYVSRLNRPAHGQFRIERAISLENFTELCEKGEVSAGILPVEEVLDGIPAFPLDESGEQKIRNGIAVNNTANLSSNIIALKRNEKLVAIAAPLGNKLQPKRVFNH